MNNINSKKIRCEFCNLEVWKKNLKKHVERCHTDSSTRSSERVHQGSCIDPENGIFLVSETLTGIQYPVHVQKYVAPGKTSRLFCESRSCQNKATACGISGIVNFECDHLLSVSQMNKSAPEVDLNIGALNDLVTLNRISQETKEECLKKKKLATSWNHVLVNKMNIDRQYSDRFIFLSVWTGETHYYSRLGRVVICFDREKMELTCKCNEGAKIRCIHKSIAKWFLLSEFPDIFDSNEFEHQGTKSFHVNPPKILVFQSKHSIDIDSIDLVESFDSNQIVVPTEDHCQLVECHGRKLELVEETKKRPKLYTRTGIIFIQRVWKKVCLNCKTEYWYNDVKNGIFNFNNHQCCHFERSSLVEHAI